MIRGLSSAHFDFGKSIRKSKTMVQLQVAIFAIVKSRFQIRPKPIKGSVSLNLTPEGDSSSFAADNDANYYYANGNAGYSGTFEIAFAEDDFLADTLGRIKDSNGMLLEVADAQAAPFALLYEISSNALPQRYVLYSCTLNRPEQ